MRNYTGSIGTQITDSPHVASTDNDGTRLDVDFKNYISVNFYCFYRCLPNFFNLIFIY